jgi:pyridoxamine 5'-phosphate oxidase
MNNIPETSAEQTLSEILAEAWAMLSRSMTEAEHPFHTPVLGTIGRYGSSLRTVVLREVVPSERYLSCYSDRRAAKVADLLTHPQASWLFYDPGQQIQLRLGGRATLHFTDQLADRAWAKVGLNSRKNYLSLQRPGTPLANPGSGLPETFDSRNLSPVESEAGRKHFAVIVCQITFLDWLQLNPDGHRRAQFIWENDKLRSNWVTP